MRIWAPKPTLSSGSSSAALATAAAHQQWHCIAVLEDFTKRTVRTCEWSPCGRFLAAGSFDSNSTVWRVKGSVLAPQAVATGGATGGAGGSAGSSKHGYRAEDIDFEAICTLEGQENEVKSVAWSPSGSILATASRDKSVWLWEAVDDGADFECLAVLHGHEQDVKFVKWHPTRELLVSCSYDDTVRVWGEAEDDWVCLQTLAGHDSTVWQLAFDTRGERMVSCSDDCRMVVWKAQTPSAADASFVVDALTFTRSAVIAGGHTRTVFSCDWARDAALLAEGSGSSSEAAAAATAASALVTGPPVLASSGADDTIRVYREESELGPGVGSATSGGSGSAASTFTQVVCVQHAHQGDVNVVRWHPTDTTLLASAGDDGLVKLWRYREL